MLLAACFYNPSVERNSNDQHAQSVTDQLRAIDLSAPPPQVDDAGAVGNSRPSRPAIYLGDTSRPIISAAGAPSDAVGEGYDLNFENAPVATVAKVILGDILGVGYTIDPRVQGTVTLASGRPVSKSDVLFVLESALRMSNVALVRGRDGYQLIPIADAAGRGFLDTTAATQPGFGISVVPLHYVSAQAILKLLDGFGIKPNSVRVESSRNLLIVQGSGAERRATVDTVLSFDGDWMRGQSVGVFPVRNGAPEPIIAEIEKIMDAHEGGLSQNMVKFQAISRLNAILVVSRKPEYLKTANTWIRRLDESDTAGTNLKVYRLRYGSAKQIAALLSEILIGRQTGGLESAQSQIAPGSGVSVSSSGGPLAALSAQPPPPAGGPQGGGIQGGGVLGGGVSGSSVLGGGATARPARAGTAGTDIPATGSAGAVGGVGLPNIRITPDITNNSILVYANQETQHIVEQTLRQIDRQPLQVAIQATIAEVTLNDTLTYGVQYYLNSANIGLANPNAGSVVSTLTGTALSSVLPGFNLVLGPASMPNMVLDALHSVTDVRVLSNPSLVVLDNESASLQVGDQVPITTGTATVLTANNTVVNTINYQNTGIVLRVVPRVTANGTVVLRIEQQTSSVTPTTAGSLTPTISNRAVQSSISVASGQTVLLAGLISDETDRTRQGIPLLDKIPGFGDLFGQQSGTKIRTELIIFIRPTVIRNDFDAHVVAEEMRSKLKGELIGGNFPGNFTGLHNEPAIHQ
jgi:general secretion pathway protein D